MKKQPNILIICIAIVIVVILIFVIYLLRGGSTEFGGNSENSSVQTMDLPKIELSIYPEDETEGNVEISINANISNGYEITSITMPDGKTMGYTSGKSYIVDENGEYSFTVTASNGKKATKTISVTNIMKSSADNPYIPEGFEHKEGTEIETGFVIQDKNNNEYVWVPVESGTLVSNPPSKKYFEDDSTSNAFNNSVSKYYGFYIAKYEASQDNKNGIVIAKSIEGCLPWTNINYEEAFSASQNTAVAYNYKDVKTALINSYAWDTALDWINKSNTNYSTSKQYGNYSSEIKNSGETKTDIVNGIADMAGNVREWTTEIYKDDISENIDNEIKNERDDDNDNAIKSNSKDKSNYRVLRGGSATMDKIANSRIGEKKELKDNYWGFRIILYKE